MTSFFFLLLATFLTISSSNPVYAVLGLISLFTFTSSYLLLLGLGFIGITYLLIYVGAIAILFLFVVMMMNLKFLTYHLLPYFLPLATIITIFYFFSNFTFFFLFDTFNFYYFCPINYPWSCLFNTTHHLTSLAYPLYSSFSLWLLFSSLVLLLGMIGPIILILTAHRPAGPPGRADPRAPAGPFILQH